MTKPFSLYARSLWLLLDKYLTILNSSIRSRGRTRENFNASFKETKILYRVPTLLVVTFYENNLLLMA